MGGEKSNCTQIFFHSHFSTIAVLPYGISTNRTAHLMTDFLKITLDKLRNDIDVYASRNMPWIEKVGAHSFEHLDVTLAVYITEMYQELESLMKWQFCWLASLMTPMRCFSYKTATGQLVVIMSIP